MGFLDPAVTMSGTVNTLKWFTRLAVLALALGIAAGQTKSAKTDAQIREEIVKESIESYKGSCACPYSKDRAGRNCGARSAYSKPDGASPLCYKEDVSQKLVDEYRKKSRQ